MKRRDSGKESKWGRKRSNKKDRKIQVEKEVQNKEARTGKEEGHCEQQEGRNWSKNEEMKDKLKPKRQKGQRKKARKDVRKDNI